MIVSMGLYIDGWKIKVISDSPPQTQPTKNKHNRKIWMYLSLGILESKRKINIYLDQRPKIVTDITKKNYGGLLLKSMVTESGCGETRGKRSKAITNWNLSYRVLESNIGRKRSQETRNNDKSRGYMS